MNHENFKLRDHCHVDTNEDGDRFVGVKADSTNAIIYFPMGYQLPSDDDELRRDVKNLFEVLAAFTDRNDKVLHMDKFTAPQSVDFPIQAYLNVINYYLDHNGNYYTEVEPTYRVDKRGKTDFKRTIQTQRPILQGENLVYLDMVIRDNTPNSNKLITRIHKYCVSESFDRIGWIYTTNKPEEADIGFDKNLFIITLNDKISDTNKDDDKKLFKSMIAMIEFMDNNTIDKQFYFGTDKFEHVWEKLIDVVFGESNKEEYFPHASWTARFGPEEKKPISALEPDSIMIYNGKYYVLDAKYYRYGAYPELGVSALPQSSDINKQITYGEFIKKNRAKDADVFNAFIMPYNSFNSIFGNLLEYVNVAEARGDWKTNKEFYERVQGIVMDTRYLLKNYEGNHDRDKEKLAKEIERVRAL
jgi:hypothetical protein